MLIHPSSWTLRTKLVASILALFILLTTATGAATVLWTRNSLINQVDAQLNEARKGLSTPPQDSDHDSNGSTATADGSDGTTSGGPKFSHHPLPGGMMRVTIAQSRTVENYVSLPSGETAKLTTTQLTAVKSVNVGPHPTTVDLGGDLGRYRMIAVQRPDGDVTIQGVPLSGLDESVSHLTQNIAALGIMGLFAMGAASFFIVRRNLRPLRRVAATAERVSELPLGEGSVRTDERLAARDADGHTEVGTVGLALNNLLDHVDSALDARQRSEMQVRQFVADASHELRTPLASIRGYAEISKREPEPVPPGIVHAMGRIESEAGRMTALVEDLLLLARLDAGRDIEQDNVDMTRILVETVSDLHAAGPDHVWRLDLPDDVEDFPEIVGDEARLRQVVINLLANARRHTPAGTIVTAGLRHDADHVFVDITDNGPGIPPEFVPHLFERFSRGDAARTRTEGSTGLGLSIVDAVVAAHGGQVEVESKPGMTRFTVALPIRPDLPAPMTPTDKTEA